MRIATGPFGDDEEHVDAVTLSRLASANGSKSCIIQKVGNGAELKKACDEISKGLYERLVRDRFRRSHACEHASTTIPIHLQVPAHNECLIDTPKSIPLSAAE